MSVLIKPGVYMFYDMLSDAEFEIAAMAEVDNDKWYTVVANRQSAKWIQEQEPGLWASTDVTNMYDVHNELMLVMKLKW